MPSKPTKAITWPVTVFFISIVFNSHAHKDRIERPNSYRFIFDNNDTVTFTSSNNPLISVYSEDIVNGRRHLIEAQLTFETGEILTISRNGKMWTEIRIAHKTAVAFVPRAVLEKISEIHIHSIALLWNGRDDRAFTADYFYIAFDLGTNKSFNKLPGLQLFFSGKNFTKATLWKQTGLHSKTWSAY